MGLRSRVLLAGAAVVVLIGPAVAVGAWAQTTHAAERATTAPAAGPGAPAQFAHPGVLVGRAQLDFVRGKLKSGAEPWKSAYDKLRTSQYASLSRTPKPYKSVDCGAYSNPNNGCTEERTDAQAAYDDALMWYFTGDDRYAKKSIEIMDAWSSTITGHTNHNAPLQTGWSGVGWAQAGELIKHAYTGGWNGADKFATMLRKVYLPTLLKGAGGNGNWELIMSDAAMGISVFLDDRASFDRALALWRGRVPAYIYLTSDGKTPKSPPARVKTGSALISFWHGQSTFVDGVAQETCRDFGHTAMGFNAAFHGADTARLQGVDLWGEQRTRFAAGLEFISTYELGASVPSWLCGGKVNKGTGQYFEPGYDALATRLGMSLPLTKKLLESRRPMGSDNHSSGFETLLFADNPT